MRHEAVYRLGLAVLGLIGYGVIAVYAWHVLAPPACWWITPDQFTVLRGWVIGYVVGSAVGLAIVWRANKRP